jgi:hypothetical protein
VFDNAGDYYLALRAIESGAPLQMMHGISQLQEKKISPSPKHTNNS